MSKIKYCREFVETRDSIYETAEEIVKLMGVRCLVDMLLEWADDAYHREIFKALEDEKSIANLTVGRI